MEENKNEIPEKFLPLGTVVLLEGATKKIMITGFCYKENADAEKIWDYNGCLYPEGFLSYNESCVFDHSQIGEVYHMGLVDEEEQEFNEKLKEFMQLHDEISDQ